MALYWGGVPEGLGGLILRACVAFSALADSYMHIYAKFPALESFSVPVQLLEARRILHRLDVDPPVRSCGPLTDALAQHCHEGIGGLVHVYDAPRSAAESGSLLKQRRLDVGRLEAFALPLPKQMP